MIGRTVMTLPRWATAARSALTVERDTDQLATCEDDDEQQHDQHRDCPRIEAHECIECIGSTPLFEPLFDRIFDPLQVDLRFDLLRFDLLQVRSAQARELVRAQPGNLDRQATSLGFGGCVVFAGSFELAVEGVGAGEGGIVIASE
jgi:hypothetical protein